MPDLSRFAGTMKGEQSRIIDAPDVHARMARSPNPFGDGRASERIAAGILSFFELAEPPDAF